MTENNNLNNNAGQPWGNNQNSQTAGSRGPVLMQDYNLLEKLAHFNRERIPERVVHAKGAGAKGVFTVTHEMSKYTKAKIFNQNGKKTSLSIRFSQVAGERGYIDTYRDVRGFAIKFYTEDGNYDIVGNNTPIFFVNDPLKFPDFIHSQKRDPQTNARSATMQWDFWSNSPETIHQVMYLMGDRGLPASYRTMNGYGSHTFKWVNDKNESFWVKYHFKSNQGVHNMTAEEANEVSLKDTDYLQDDLFQAIKKGDFPSWKVYVQIIPFEEGLHYTSDIFDVTKVVSHKDYPLQEIGEFTLNENPENYFTEIEELAMSPANFVPGIEASPDKLLQGRLFGYKDAQRYRLGANFEQLPGNKPLNKVNNYERDGFMNIDNHGSEVNYEPNSFNGPKQDENGKIASFEVHGDAQATAYNYKVDNFSQPRDLWRNVFTENEKKEFIETVTDQFKMVNNDEIVRRQIELFKQVDENLGNDLANNMNIK